MLSTCITTACPVITDLEYFIRSDTHPFLEPALFFYSSQQLVLAQLLIKQKCCLYDIGQVNVWKYCGIILFPHLKSLLSHLLCLLLLYSIFPGSSTFTLWAFYWPTCWHLDLLYKYYLDFVIYEQYELDILIMSLHLHSLVEEAF